MMRPHTRHTNVLRFGGVLKRYTMGVMLRILPLLLASAGFGDGAAPLEFRLTSEAAPAGALAQVKVYLLTPQPIASGNLAFVFQRGGRVDLEGAAVTGSIFSASGDASGIVWPDAIGPFRIR